VHCGIFRERGKDRNDLLSEFLSKFQTLNYILFLQRRLSVFTTSLRISKAKFITL